MKKISATLFLFSIMMFSDGLEANCFSCFDGVSIGGDFLYWQPCISDLDYAIEGNDTFEEADEFKTKFIDPQWDPGYRAWIRFDNLYCGFNFAAVYTYFDTTNKDSFDTQDEDSIRLSTSLPFDIDTPNGEVASGKWDFNYQAVDLLLSYSLQLSNMRNFEATAFSGVKWLKLSQERHDRLSGNGEGEDPDDGFRINRELDYWGIGPVLGVNTAYELCPNLRVLGMFSTALVIGETDSKDHFFNTAEETEDEFDVKFKDNDDCFCFPGFHFATAISYSGCCCGTMIEFHIGWEYIHWVNAPSFPYYEKGEWGVRSGDSEKSITLQGVFAGFNISF